MIPSSSLSIAAKSSWLKGSDINIQSFLDSLCFPLFSWWGFEVRHELIECLACTVFASATASWFKEVLQSGCKLTKEKLTTSSNGGHVYFLSLFSRKRYRLQFPKQRKATETLNVERQMRFYFLNLLLQISRECLHILQYHCLIRSRTPGELYPIGFVHNSNLSDFTRTVPSSAWCNRSKLDRLDWVMQWFWPMEKYSQGRFYEFDRFGGLCSWFVV